MKAYAIVGQSTSNVSEGVHDPRMLSRFVGREQELGRLIDLLAYAEAGEGQVVGVAGEPGMGKTRLLHEFRQCLRARQPPVIYVEAQCLSYGQATPYRAVRDILRQLCRIAPNDGAEAITAKVNQHLQAVEVSAAQWGPYLLHLLGVEVETDGLAHQTPQAVKAKTFEALCQLCLQGQRRQPLIMAIENIHWIDATSEDFLTSLIERLTGSALLVLLTYRPGYRPSWIDKSYATQFPLRRLTRRDSVAIVESAIPIELIPEALLQTLLEKAAGNPFFLEELAQTLVEGGVQARPLTIPSTIHAVLAARIDRLPVTQRQLLQMAAVIGIEVPLSLLHAITIQPEEETLRHLQSLQASEFLYETRAASTPTYTFKHALTQEVAYQSLLERERQAFHRRIAEAVEARFPETVATQPEILAHHYTAAGAVEQAIVYWQQAGQQALRRSANVEAGQHFTIGLELLARLSDTPSRRQRELDIRVGLGPALIATRGYAAPEVEQTYARARALCAQVGDTPEIFPVLRGLCGFYLTQGALPTAWEIGEQLDRLAQREDISANRLEAHDTLGGILFYMGEYGAAQARLEQVITRIDPAAQRALAFRQGAAPGVRCLSVAALSLWCMGYPAQAVQRSEEALTLARDLGHPQSLAMAYHWTAVLHYYRRAVSDVQVQAESLLSLSTAQEFPLWMGFATYWQGWAMVIQGEEEAGLKRMHQAMAAITTTGQALSRPFCQILLADATQHAGQADVGLRLLAEALTTLKASGRSDLLAEAYRLQGELLLRQRSPDAVEAEVCFQQALDIAHRQLAKSWALRAALSLSRLWQQQGKLANARQLLTETYGWFTEGFDTTDLQEAQALLDTLAA